jgi:radical SAM superfamily enzyme
MRCSIEYGYTCPNYENRKAKREICENCKFKIQVLKTFVDSTYSGGKKIVEPIEETKNPKKEKWIVRLARFLIKKYGE